MQGALWTAAEIRRLVSELGLSVRGDGPARQSAGHDFGHLVVGQPRAVVEATCQGDVEVLLAFATAEGLRVTARGAGYSQSGQSVPLDGISLDVGRLDHVSPPDTGSMTLECGAGARWRNIVRRCANRGVLPEVMPLNLDLTVGGVLSAGGIGATSHVYGPAVATVTEVGGVTGDGRGLLSTPAAPDGLCAALLAGLGRAGVITSVRLRLRRVRPRVRVFCLLYESAAEWLGDQRRLADERGVDYLEGLCVARVLGTRTTPAGRRPAATWSYVSLVGIEYEDGQAPSGEDAVRGLSGKLMFVDDDDTFDYAARYDGRFEAMHRTGAWTQAHPWIETLLPEGILPTLLPDLLEAIPMFLGDGHRVALVAQRGPALFMFPKPGPAVAFSVLPVGVAEGLREDALRALRRVHDLGTGAGGKRYLSGWLGMMDEPAWRAHYGDAFDDWIAAKQRFDPRGTLVSTLFPGASRG